MQYKSVIYFLLNFAWYFIQLDIVQNLRNCWKIICSDMSPYYCTYEERKKLNELEIQQVYGRVTPFLRLQILMSSLQIQKTKYKGGEKCFSNHQCESTKLLHYQKLAYSLHIMFAIVKKMIFWHLLMSGQPMPEHQLFLLNQFSVISIFVFTSLRA